MMEKDVPNDVPVPSTPEALMQCILVESWEEATRAKTVCAQREIFNWKF